MLLVKQLAYVNLEVALAFIKTLETQVKDANAKYAKAAEDTAQVEEDLCVRIALLELSLKAKKDRIAQFEKDCVDEVARDKDALADLPEAYYTIRCKLVENEKALRKVRIELTAKTSELEELRLGGKKIEEELSVARADVALQTSLLDESRGKLNAKVSELKGVLTHLGMKENEPTTSYDEQSKTTAELARLCKQISNKTAETAGLELLQQKVSDPLDVQKLSVELITAWMCHQLRSTQHYSQSGMSSRIAVKRW